MDISQECDHRRNRIETIGPRYRQVHPNNFQDGRALPPAFILQETSCHLTLSLNDGARTSPDKCYEEYTATGRKSAAVLQLTNQDLHESGHELTSDSPKDQTTAHVDAAFPVSLSRRRKREIAQSLAKATNRNGTAYMPRNTNISAADAPD